MSNRRTISKRKSVSVVASVIDLKNKRSTNVTKWVSAWRKIMEITKLGVRAEAQRWFMDNAKTTDFSKEDASKFFETGYETGLRAMMILGTWLYVKADNFEFERGSADRIALEDMVQQLLQQDGIEFLKPKHLVHLPSEDSDCLQMISGERIEVTNPESLVEFFLGN